MLSQFAGLSCVQIAALAAGDLSISDGVAIVRTVGGKTILRRVDDDLLCGPCALARWVHALDLTVVYPDGRVIAALIARAVPLTADSPHLCQSNNGITEPTRRVALMRPSISGDIRSGSSSSRGRPPARARYGPPESP